MNEQRDRKTEIGVSAPSEYAERGEKIAASLGLPFSENDEDFSLALRYDADGLSLTDGELVIRGDFEKMLPRLKEQNLRGEMLVKAAKIKGNGTPLVIDATAGLGEDSFLLAAAGCRVILYEYDKIIAALLRDAMERASTDPRLSDVMNRMTLREENSINAMRCLSEKPDIILLDPMFPERQKSALVKKKFQLIHLLEKPCDAEEELLFAALSADPMKIIIKRPLKGPYLGGKKPSYSLEGKAIRYDCLVFVRKEE